LAAELATRARAAGATVLAGRCIDLVGSGLPYLPFVEALRPLGGSPLLDAAGEGPRELARLRLFERTVAVLERLGAAAPVVLVLEDLHWADESTLDLAAYVAHALGELPVLLVLTYRSDGLPAGSPVRRFATELLRAGA